MLCQSMMAFLTGEGILNQLYHRGHREKKSNVFRFKLDPTRLRSDGVRWVPSPGNPGVIDIPIFISMILMTKRSVIHQI